MAGTPNRNTRRPVNGGNRRPAQGNRRPQNGGTRRPASGGTRRPANNRRRTARRRYTPFFMRPGFWLFACIVVIILILIFKGCDGDGKDKDKDNGSTEQSTYIYTDTQRPTAEPETTKPTTSRPSTDEPDNTPTVKPTEKPTEEPTEEPTSSPTETPTEEPTQAPPVGNQTYGTHRVNPGFYLLGEDLAAGSVTIEVASGSGSIRTSDGRLSIASADTSTDKITGVVFSAGEYLSVTGDIKLTVVYVTEKINVSLPRPTVKEDGGYAILGEAGADFEYYVMSEGGDLTPGIYQVQINEGMGVINIPDRVTGASEDYTVGVYDGYNKIIDYVVLNEGDTVTIKGCTVEFIEMKEG